MRTYRTSTPERLTKDLAAKQKWQREVKANPERATALRARQAEAKSRYLADPDNKARVNATRRETTARFRQRHFFEWRARMHRSRFGVDITAADLARLWIEQRGRCALSGYRLDRTAHLDHIVPIVGGGSHGIENLRWLDPNVNLAKRAMSDADFIAMCKSIVAAIG